MYTILILADPSSMADALALALATWNIAHIQHDNDQVERSDDSLEMVCHCSPPDELQGFVSCGLISAVGLVAPDIAIARLQLEACRNASVCLLSAPFNAAWLSMILRDDPHFPSLVVAICDLMKTASRVNRIIG